MIKKANTSQTGFVNSDEFCQFLAKDLTDLAGELNVEIEQPKQRKMSNSKASMYNKKMTMRSNKKSSIIGRGTRLGRKY